MLERLRLTLRATALTLSIGFVCVIALASPAVAQWDLEGWLAEPDVKLVAVEFYADWCEPCKKAAPKWEALRKKYAPRGLKLVVVNLSEGSGDKGQCSRLPWNPDESICDPRLGEELGVTELPEAFVWSWQGNLLVERGKHVSEVEAIIRRYLDDNPRVSVVAEDPGDKVGRQLQRLVEAKLNESGKLTVVPDAEMQKRLANIRRKSHSASRRKDQRCQLGAEVSANSLLTIERFPASIALRLVNANTGCQFATVSVDWDKKRPAKSVNKAVFKLMNQLMRRRVEMPQQSQVASKRGAKRRQVSVREVEGETEEWSPEADDEVLVIKFDSDPQGAQVTLDGEALCPKTPCRREVPTGRHEVEMRLDRYATRSRSVTFEEGQNVSWSLQPTFGTLTVTSTPSGVSVKVDGEAVGETPLQKLELPEGEHTVVVGDRCHQPQTRELTLPRGKTHTLEVTLTPRPAGLKVKAIDSSGDVLTGDVYVDGAKLGKTGKTHKVAVCAKTIEVRHKKYGSWTSELKLTLQERKTSTLIATLSESDGRSAVRVGEAFVRIEPGTLVGGSPLYRVILSRAFMLQATEVTQGQWKALMGTTPSKFSSRGDSLPVEKVSWWDAVAYTNALSKREGLPTCYQLSGCSGRPGDGEYKCSRVKVTTGGGNPLTCKGYRLPTEAEWEYAARAGTAGPSHSWELSRVAWYENNSVSGTHPVGEKEPNAWGLFDMLGNVWEWTWNWSRSHKTITPRDPIGPSSGSYRVVRGCGWSDTVVSCLAGHGRNVYAPDHSHDYLGFRPARTLFDQDASEDPKEVSKWLVQQGVKAFKEGKYARAREHFERAVKLDPENENARKLLEASLKKLR